MILTAELAAEIVTRAMHIIHHNVNVISPDGIIVASGDKRRIGTVHEMGWQAAKQRQVISIYDEDVSGSSSVDTHYAPGINTPIIVSGEVLCVVGVSGNPHEISRYAALAVLTAELSTKQALKNREINWNWRFADLLLIKCLQDESRVDEAAVEHLATLYDFALPRIPYLIQIQRADGRADPLVAGLCLQEILRRLAIYLDNDEVSLLAEDLMLVLTSIDEQELPYQDLMTQVCREHEMQLVAIKGLPAVDVASFLKSLRFAKFCLLNRGQTLDCARAHDVLSAALASRPYQLLLDLIRKRLTHSKLALALQLTIKTYVQAQLEQQKTAQSLHIHRNTLKNRFKIIKELTGLDPELVEDLVVLYFACQEGEGGH